MAYIEQLPSGRYRATIRVAGKRHKATFDYAYEAEAWAATAGQRAVLAAQLCPKHPAYEADYCPVCGTTTPIGDRDMAAPAPTVHAHGTTWIDRREGRLATATVSNYRHHLRYLDAEGMGRTPMDRIKRSDVEAWQTRMVKSGVGRATLNARLKVLRMIYRDAMAEFPEAVRHDPTAGVDVLPTATKRDRILTAVEEVRLLGALDPADRLPILLALDAGLRWSEVFALDADCLVLGDDTLPSYVIVRAAVERTGYVRPYTKGHRDRVVPLTPRVRDLLAARVAEVSDGGLLFRSEAGSAVDYFNYRHRVFRPARYAAGVRGLGFHDLRHTYGTRLSRAGVPRKEIAVLMGHADEETTARYIHAGEDGHRAALVMAALAPAPALTAVPA